MAHFETRISTPDQYDLSSWFFRVAFPSFSLSMTVAFFQNYWLSNGYPLPALMRWPFTVFLGVCCFIWLWRWYHKKYDRTGKLLLDETQVQYNWRDLPTKSIPLSDIENMHIIYEGIETVLGPSTGCKNVLSIKTKDNQEYKFNFVLINNDEADKMSEIVQSWHKQGVNVHERDTDGNERFALLYPAKYKFATPNTAVAHSKYLY